MFSCKICFCTKRLTNEGAYNILPKKQQKHKATFASMKCKEARRE